jgi:ABC-type branched-subunit amino acid transport system substrate-binding protein
VRKRLAGFLIGLLGLTACRSPELWTIGLVAPFEGRDRAIGYDLIFGARLAIREWNARHPDGPWAMLLALDDGGDPERAQERARQITACPGLIAVIGHFRPETTRAAAPVYREAGVLWIAPLLPADRVPAGAMATAADTSTMVEALMGSLPQASGSRFWMVRDGEEQWFGPEAVAVIRARGWQVVEARWTEADPQGEEPVLFDGRAVHAGEAVRRWRQAGWRGLLFGGPGLLHPDLRALIPGDPGIRVVAETRRVDDPGWVAAYRALSLGTPPGPYAALGYDLAWALLQARRSPSFRWEGRTGIWEGDGGRLRKVPALWVDMP